MPEWSNGADSKSVGRLSWPGGSSKGIPLGESLFLRKARISKVSNLFHALPTCSIRQTSSLQTNLFTVQLTYQLDVKQDKFFFPTKAKGIIFLLLQRRNAGVVERGRLEICWPALLARGFFQRNPLGRIPLSPQSEDFKKQ